MKAYPYGGFSQFITAPEDALVRLPDNVSFENAARFGYLGTAYSAMKKLGVGPGQHVPGQRHQRPARAVRGDARARHGRRREFSAPAATCACSSASRRWRRSASRCFRSTRPRRPRRPTWRPAIRGPSWPGRKSLTDGYGVDTLLDCLPPGAPAARHDAGALYAAPRRTRRQCRRGDGDAAAQRVLADDQPHLACRARSGSPPARARRWPP